jgi:hypothetical protein
MERQVFCADGPPLKIGHSAFVPLQAQSAPRQIKTSKEGSSSVLYPAVNISKMLRLAWGARLYYTSSHLAAEATNTDALMNAIGSEPSQE